MAERSAVRARTRRARISLGDEGGLWFNFAKLGGIAISAIRVSQESVMLNSKSFDDIAARIGKAIDNSPAKDIEKNVKTMLASGLARLDLVPRAEFDVQAQVLLKTRAKLEALEKRLAELEARIPPPSA